MSIDAVRAAKDDVINKSVPQTTNEFPWLVTNLVAWRTGGKLIGKSAAQNHWVYRGERYAIDAIAYPESNLEVDCLINAGPPDNGNVPAWSASALKPARYLPPIDPTTIWPTTYVPLVPSPPPNGHIALMLARLAEAETRISLLETHYLGLLRRMQAEEQKPIQPHVHTVLWFKSSGPT